MLQHDLTLPLSFELLPRIILVYHLLLYTNCTESLVILYGLEHVKYSFLRSKFFYRYIILNLDTILSVHAMYMKFHGAATIVLIVY